MERALVRWLAAIVMACVITFGVSAALGAVGTLELIAIFVPALALSWFLVVRRGTRTTPKG